MLWKPEACDRDDLEEQADAHDAAAAHAARELRGAARDEERADREPRHEHARVEGRVPEDALEVERQGEEHAELAERDDERRDRAVAQAADAQQAEVEQDWAAGGRAASLDDDERPDGEHADRECERDGRHRVLPRPAADGRRVLNAPPAVALPLDEDADRHVDEERPVPGEVGREPAANERADGGHAADRRPPDRERDAALTPGEHGVHRGERRRQDHGAANTLEQAASEQDAAARCAGRDEARGHEYRDADEEQIASTEQVTHAASDTASIAYQRLGFGAAFYSSTGTIRSRRRTVTAGRLPTQCQDAPA